jgi:O-antigen biosynthesis protein
MKVLQVCQAYPPEFTGGSTHYAIELAKKLIQDGVSTEILCGTENPSIRPYEIQTTMEKGCYVTRMGLPKKRGYGAGHIEKVRQGLRNFLADRKIEIVHFHSAVGIGEGIILEAHDQGVKCVVTAHEGWWLCANLFFRNNHRKTMCVTYSMVKCVTCQLWSINNPNNKEWLKDIVRSIRRCHWILSHRRLSLSAVDQIVAVCDFIKEKYIQFGVTCPITVIKNRVNESKIHFKPIHEMQLPLKLGALGVFRSRKDGDLLIKALSLLGKKRYDFVLHVWSSVDVKYKEMFDDFCARFNVINHGPYGPDDLNSIFSTIDLLVYPSSSADTYPLTLLESLASRTPIVAARSHGMEEIIRDGENGKSFEPLNVISLAKAIEYFLESPQRIETIQNSMEPPPPYDGLVSENRKIYENLVGSKL